MHTFECDLETQLFRQACSEFRTTGQRMAASVLILVGWKSITRGVPRGSRRRIFQTWNREGFPQTFLGSLENIGNYFLFKPTL